MQLEDEPAAGPAPRLDLTETGEMIAILHLELSEDATLRADEAESARWKEGLRLDEESDYELEGATSEGGERRREQESLRDDRLGRIAAATKSLEDRLKDELNEIRRDRESAIDQVRERLDQEDDRQRAPLNGKVRRWHELLPVVRERSVATVRVLADFADLHGVAVSTPAPAPVEVEAEADADLAADVATRAFEDVLLELRRLGRRPGASLARTGHRILYFALLLALGAGGAIVATHLDLGTPIVAGIAGATAALILLLAVTARRVRRCTETGTRDLHLAATEADRRFERTADAALKRLDAQHVEFAEAHRAAREEAENRIRRESQERAAPALARLEKLKDRSNRAEWRVLARHGERLARLDAERQARDRRRQDALDAAVRERDEAHRARMEVLDRAHAERVAELDARRAAGLASFTRFAGALREAVSERNPTWAGIDPRRVALPASFPHLVSIAHLDVSPAALIDGPADGEEAAERIPLTLGFPEHGSILVRHAGAERDAALAVLTNAVLRVLTSFPAGKARLTMVDPVGLGQSFSALMHLADHDEALVNGRIWTETQHIERRLANLTEHIEKVIQKYLRNRFNTIGEYNVEAGELMEPYHFLVIADYPAGFSDLAAERLASIVSSGPRCGVYTFLAEDVRLPAPPAVDPKLLARNGPVLVAGRGGFRLAGEGLGRATFVPESPPDAEFVSALLDTVGRQSVDADRVEVPFAAVIPGPNEIWTARTDRGVRVAIGRTGAERLQHFDLGRGTAQHALIAGRTGSGKSTLFHVLITNMALWFGPDQVEFYLIDFKKGVEFKPFAIHGLPHARVIAIESDREFGLSVLKEIDAELGRRGDLFRHHAVQDLAAYRRHPGAKTLPRTLVMIDEFQEFFTEDDAVARDAALLLDRFVRQGRAFGIHIVLGSQTLSGIYTLARSTLGQMGVRIALQCNEADSHLILSDDNGVARLLTRPGEAIYNDMSGLIEGNNPFQIVWLPEEVEAEHLKMMAARAVDVPVPVRHEMVVFEGNMPAIVVKNPDLMRAIATGVPAGADRDDRMWLGEPNAIKGPTEVRFMPASGSNLLMVGQRRDAAFAMMAAGILGLSAQHRGKDLRLVILDGGGHEPEYAGHFDRLIAAVPHEVERYDLRNVAGAVADLAELVKSRADLEGAPAPVYVFAFGLQRLRVLRRGDEFAMPFGEAAEESAGDQFGTILTDGPARGVHTIVWSATLMNHTRTLSRQATREFDMRVLFQMSAADSSELIDSSAANLLGLYNALLVIESDGTFEKFRPYAIPPDYDFARRP